jgi:hypothetical protein
MSVGFVVCVSQDCLNNWVMVDDRRAQSQPITDTRLEWTQPFSVTRVRRITVLCIANIELHHMG